MYEQVFTAAPQPIVIADRAGNTKAVNEAFVRTFGYTAEDVPNRAVRMHKMVPDPTYRGELFARWDEARRRGGSMLAEPIIARVTCKDGSERVIELRATFSPGESVSILTDITDRERGEQERRRLSAARAELQAELSVQSNALPLALVVSGPSDELTTLEWNPAAERIFGYTREEAIGKSGYDLIIPLEGRELVRTAMSALASSSETVRSFGRNRTKDGRLIDCEWFTTAVRDEHGRIVRIIAMVHDVTERLAAVERMRLWTSVLEQSSDGIMICDPEQRILVVNRAFERLTGYTTAEALGQTPRIMQSGRHDEAFYADMWRQLRASGEWRGEVWNRRKDRRLYVARLALNAVRDEAGTLTHYVGIFSDVTEHKAAEERIQRLAQYDALTELPNRALLSNRLEQLIAMARRNGQRIAVLFMDLDRFKDVNDSMGHDAGDALLQTVARRITGAVRQSDTVARMGGDEFVILLPDVGNGDQAARIADKLLKVVREPLLLRGQELSISASIGICIYPDDAPEAGDLIRNADAAMYQAKSAGRNEARFYTRELNERAMARLQTINALRVALDRGEFELHYQPQVNVAGGAIVGVEALIRWNRPGCGLIMPNEFMPLAEERGLGISIGNWVVREALRQLRAWDAAGLPRLTMAVNVSAGELHDRALTENVAQALLEYGVHAERLDLELTESAAIEDLRATTETLSALHELGCRLSLDDFGTGYSSLNHLRIFPIDRIKIDRSFVVELDSNPDTIRTVRAIVALAKAHGMSVVAEGVETPSQLALLREQRCDEIQGYLASRPLPAAALERLLREWRPGALG